MSVYFWCPFYTFTKFKINKFYLNSYNQGEYIMYYFQVNTIHVKLFL
jgi:hypothetical protein